MHRTAEVTQGGQVTNFLQQDWSTIALQPGGYGPLGDLHVAGGELVFCLHSHGCGRVAWYAEERDLTLGIDFPDLGLDTIAKVLDMPAPLSLDRTLRPVEDPASIQWLIDLLTLHLTICGHPAAAAAFVERWADGMGARVRRHGLALDDQHDVLQDFWLLLFRDCCRRLRSCRDPRALPAWMMQVVDRLALEHHRRMARERSRVDPGIDPDILTGPGWERRLIDELTVEEMMALLPPRERKVLQMLYRQGHTATEVGAMLGVSEGAVRALAYRARQRLLDLGVEG